MEYSQFFGGLGIGLIVGAIAGFFTGVASVDEGRAFLTDMVETEKDADVAQPKEIVRKTFKLQYPGNWMIDTADEDYDPDHRFSIDSPGSGFVMFHLFDGEIDAETLRQTQIDQFTSTLMKNASVKKFETWGNYQGAGATLTGPMLGVSPGTVQIFGHSTPTRAFLIVAQYPDDDAAMVKPGVDLIARSFSLID